MVVQDIWLAGGVTSGYQMIRGEDDIPRVVYCDMDRLPGQTGFQRQFSRAYSQTVSRFRMINQIGNVFFIIIIIKYQASL